MLIKCGRYVFVCGTWRFIVTIIIIAVYFYYVLVISASLQQALLVGHLDSLSTMVNGDREYFAM